MGRERRVLRGPVTTRPEEGRACSERCGQTCCLGSTGEPGLPSCETLFGRRGPLSKRLFKADLVNSTTCQGNWAGGREPGGSGTGPLTLPPWWSLPSLKLPQQIPATSDTFSAANPAPQPTLAHVVLRSAALRGLEAKCIIASGQGSRKLGSISFSPGGPVESWGLEPGAPGGRVGVL